MTAERVDVLVVGGGPAGLIAAREVARRAPRLAVVLIERDPAIGAPVRCGEGVGSAGIREFIEPDGAPWVSRKISRVILKAPDGSEVYVAEGDVGFILDRTSFEPALAEQAAAAGAEIRVATEATSVRRSERGWCVSIASAQGEFEVDARVVIAADGVEGMTARWAGLDTRVPSKDMESCAQYVAAGTDHDPDAIVLHFGQEVAPGGYAWVFPKGDGLANIGLGVVALRAKHGSARRYLDRYMDAYHPRAERRSLTVGGVITHPTIKRTVCDAMLVCGDAAHMINPLSGGGIVNAMKAGRLAAHAAVDALAAADTSAARLARYHDAWMSLLGDDHVRFHRVKEALTKSDDAFFDGLARTVNGIAPEKRTLGRIFAHALVRQPALLGVIGKYFV
jgi:digeranylgeranylglycerophospholipid reductase